MDNNVPPYNTLLVADGLIKANKEFDMLLIPNSGHGFAPANYVMRRRWDYFVKYLLDADPPRDYVIPAAPAGVAGAAAGLSRRNEYPSRSSHPDTALVLTVDTRTGQCR
jgi:prolyl oligopeptidase family protein